MSIDFIDSKKLAARIAELKEELAQLLHLQTFVSTKPKRGRPPGTKVSAKPAKSGKRAKRGKLGESILKFLSGKGKEGAHIKDIAAAAGAKVANVTAWFYSTGKKNKDIKKSAACHLRVRT